jgi:general stress protein YciG
MNEDNLIPNWERTPEERQEIARKGGIASGKARRERKALKEALLVALNIEKGNKTVQEIGVEALLQKFMSGDIQAFTTVRDTIGEKPTDKVEAAVNSEVNINIELTDD